MGLKPAELILLPQVQTINQVKRDKREEARFGSSDACWSTVPRICL